MSPDVRTQLMLAIGNWNMANIVAAGGDIALFGAAGHWFNILAVELRESTEEPGHHKLTRRELEVAVYQIVTLNAALQGKTIDTTAAAQGAAADIRQYRRTEIMSGTVLGNEEVPVTLRVSHDRRHSQLRPALGGWELGQTRDLAGYTGATRPRDIENFEHDTCSDLSSGTEGPFEPSPRRATLPRGGGTAASKLSALFGEPLEVGKSGEIRRPGYEEMPQDVRKDTLFVVQALCHGPPEFPQLLFYLGATAILETASRYR